VRDCGQAGKSEAGPDELKARGLADFEIAAGDEHPPVREVQHAADDKRTCGGPRVADRSSVWHKAALQDAVGAMSTGIKTSQHGRRAATASYATSR
jgi:hypothetical protein